MMSLLERKNRTYDNYARRFHWPTQGFGTVTGGAGQSIVKVTNRNASGAGSLLAALSAGNRTIVFEVGGVIDMAYGTLLMDTIDNVTIAGQTAPPPGIIIKNGFLRIYDCENIIVSHLTGFVGNAGGGSDYDFIQTEAASQNVVIDHCSGFWGKDETISVSGYPSSTTDLAAVRSTVSRKVAVTNCVIAEPLTSPGYGTAITDGCNDVLYARNYWVNCDSRTPLIKAGAQAALVNNLQFNARIKFVEYTLETGWWEGVNAGAFGSPYPSGDIALVGNVVRAGPTTSQFLGLVHTDRVEGSGSASVSVYAADNDAKTYAGATMSTVIYEEPGKGVTGTTAGSPWKTIPIATMAASDVPAYVYRNVGARPWNREANVTRVLDYYVNLDATADQVTAEGTYPSPSPTTKTFVDADWELSTMIPLRASALAA